MRKKNEFTLHSRTNSQKYAFSLQLINYARLPPFPKL